MSPDPVPLAAGGVRLLPVLHGAFEFALEVRRAFAARRPGAIAVEFPPAVEEAVRRGVARLPDLSIVLYQEPDESYVYLPIEPQDAMVEAVRLALEHDLPLHFIDEEVEGYAQHRESFPDPHAIRLAGYRAWVEGLVDPASRLDRTPLDDERERTMATALQELGRRHEDVLAVVGLVHARRVIDLVAGAPLKPPFRRPRKHGAVRLANLSEKSSREVLSETAWIAAAWEHARGTPLPLPSKPPARVVSFARTPAPQPPPPAAVLPLPERSIDDLDRNRLNLDLIKAAARRYLAEGVGRLTPQEIRNLFKFTRNWALLQGMLLPRLYELIIGARAVADDNFAYEVWDLGTTYPWQTPDPSLSTVEVTAEQMLLDGKTVRFRRKGQALHRIPVPVRQRPEWKPQEWKEKWRGFSVCSHPPEDVVVEGFGSYLRSRAVAALAEEGSKVEPFTTSLLDGIDIKETIRNWHREERLWVRERRPVKGKVGSVVMIFDDDSAAGAADGAERYPWKLTWLGEHDQESDMALYATPPGQVLVGPGISRCEYGGFMMTYPPRRVFDVWEDPYFQGSPSKPDRLLHAAIAYSLERMVAYVAARPPRPSWRAFAARVDRKIVYLPIGQFSPPMLRRLRVFHVLDGHHVRRYATDYVR